MIDPIQRMLREGGGILARRIVNNLLPNSDMVTQEIAIEILDRTFRYASDRAWDNVRSDLITQFQQHLLPHLGNERTDTLLTGLERQINRIARERGIEAEGNWLTRTTRTRMENERQRMIEANLGPGYEETSHQEWQQLSNQHFEEFNRHRQQANEYGERQNMEQEDEESTIQRERNWLEENNLFSGKVIIQFAS
jgi:hypothetical protein